MLASTVGNRGLCYGDALQSIILKAPTEMQNERKLRLGGEEVKLWRLPARKQPLGDIPSRGSRLGRNKHQKRGCGFALMKKWEVLACVESGRSASARRTCRRRLKSNRNRR